ncbi:hypothetical protein NPIL_607341 [Nephila pilipes]|uniref:Uncharacterized protein n=1 Tax=Nephila pilipes TaxID=299642 RepID=A0A8X6QI19_NEPPI|nr:hypothetical protein NPIL_607341 [Nephila pilipes]
MTEAPQVVSIPDTMAIINIIIQSEQFLQADAKIEERSSTLSLRNKRLIYLQYLHPLLIYACAIWGITSQRNINRLQLLQNRALSLITNSPIFIPRRVLNNDRSVESIPQVIGKLPTSFYSTFINHHNPTINSLARSILPNGRRKLPVIAQVTPSIF